MITSRCCRTPFLGSYVVEMDLPPFLIITPLTGGWLAQLVIDLDVRS
jgi:hypothetical protein